ncbi:uncharacterized protein LOC126081571 [Elephas maximus indicus]|uniref:uncharacterized protein LOC126081571 n=1 Tax=Elephas maximus indicus TaxID=99487 RepID=UPI002115E375|nr:uncharacterized protein LOC126081571 [Elephas maximus indicus]
MKKGQNDDLPYLRRVSAPFRSSEAAAIFRPRRIATTSRRSLAPLLCSRSHCRHRPGPRKEALARACGHSSFSVMKARLQSRPRCTSAGSWDRPAGASGRRGGRAGCTGRSGPGGGWDLKVPLHLLPVLGPGTLEEPGWRLQKIPGWRKQPRARVAAAGVSERDEPPETEPRPRPAPSPLHAPPPSSVGWLRAPGAGVTSGKVGAQRRFRVSGASIRVRVVVFSLLFALV